MKRSVYGYDLHGCILFEGEGPFRCSLGRGDRVADPMTRLAPHAREHRAGRSG